MKVILKEEIKNLGKEWDLVTVADGYARNFLLPRNLAMLATQAGVKDLERRRHKASNRRKQEEEVARTLATRVEAVPVSIIARSGPEGRLYGSVTASDIADYFQQHGIELDRRKIVIAEPIRTVGEHHVTVELHSSVAAHVRVQVNPEGGMPAAAEETPGATVGSESAGESGAATDPSTAGAAADTDEVGAA